MITGARDDPDLIADEQQFVAKAQALGMKVQMNQPRGRTPSTSGRQRCRNGCRGLCNKWAGRAGDAQATGEVTQIATRNYQRQSVRMAIASSTDTPYVTATQAGGFELVADGEFKDQAALLESVP